MRLTGVVPSELFGTVSIHTPWEGCDFRWDACPLLSPCFNSHTLGRVRPPFLALCVVVGLFQFTHPGKGATENIVLLSANDLVSIHTPWEGCDEGGWLTAEVADVFQFTHPGKGATTSRRYCSAWSCGFNSHTLGRVRPVWIIVSLPVRCFNSHTLGRVRLGADYHRQPAILVSIHTPWEGCDGVTARLNAVLMAFQFTHPGKGATLVYPPRGFLRGFQFTHPGKGATRGTLLRRVESSRFNSHTLGRVRLNLITHKW